MFITVSNKTKTLKKILLLCLLLTGCMYNPEYRVNSFKKECEALGMTESSPQFQQCVVDLNREWHSTVRALATSSQVNNNQIINQDVVAPYATPTQHSIPNATPVYAPNQCIGAQVNGECHGSVMGVPSAICHGTMLNGECIGSLMPR